MLIGRNRYIVNAWMAGTAPAMTGLECYGFSRHQKNRARLFRRARHLDHPEVAADHLWLRGRHLHRRPRPGRGARAGAGEGADARHQAGQHLHRGPARGVRPRLRVPDVPRQRALRGAVPARHLDRAAADRQEADRDRRESRRRRGVSWRDGKGQRPGALRARLLRAQSVDQDRGAVAGVDVQGARRALEFARANQIPIAKDKEGEAPFSVDANLLHSSSEGKVLEDPGADAAVDRLYAHALADGRARQADRGPHRLCEGRRGVGRRQGDVAGGDPHAAQRAGAGQRHRPARSRGEPLRRHEVARRLRDAGRHDPAWRRIAPSSRSRSTAARRISRTRSCRATPS